MNCINSDVELRGYSATYCPEDNKIRLYTDRVPRDEYEALRAAGYKSTPKQDCDFVATWSPKTEDAALAMLDPGDDIGDEDQSPEDRAVDRAERFSMYRDKRRGEAHDHADNYDAQPQVHGFQNEAKAERSARRHDRQRTNAVSQWTKAEYWQTRTTGVISHAIHNSTASVRRGRILKLEADLRRWGKHSERWASHLELRLAYERQMLAAQGGTVAEVDIQPGGFIGGHQVQKVNRSPITKAVVSVTLLAPKRWWHGEGEAPLVPQAFNIQRYGEDAYRAPTDAELEAFQAQQAEAKKATKAANAGKPKLINPTDEDAQRLQDHWNDAARHAWLKHCEEYIHNKPDDFEPSTVQPMTQAEYSAAYKGFGGGYEVIAVCTDGHAFKRQYQDSPKTGEGVAFKVRKSYGSSKLYGSAHPNRVIVITDKPQKPLPQFVQAEAVTA